MRYWLLVLLTALLLAFSLVFLQGARAQEVNTGIICDTQDEISAVMQSDDTSEAVRIIDISIPDACANATVKFYRGKYAKLVRNDGVMYEITPIYVLGINDPEGAMVPVTSNNIQWAAFKSGFVEAVDHDSWATSPYHEWYDHQKVTPETKKAYDIVFDSCCDTGDVCQMCVVHQFSNHPPWTDGWYYELDGKMKPLPPHIIEYVPWTPTGKPVLFVYPYDGGKVPKGTPVCLKVPAGDT